MWRQVCYPYTEWKDKLICYLWWHDQNYKCTFSGFSHFIAGTLSINMYTSDMTICKKKLYLACYFQSESLHVRSVSCRHYRGGSSFFYPVWLCLLVGVFSLLMLNAFMDMIKYRSNNCYLLFTCLICFCPFVLPFLSFWAKEIYTFPV